ncbi:MULTISPECIES: type II toxin-antitoxin system RelB/DinJ family antitoxin [Pseudomonas syringae group]|uniref:Type II toxin-antitoxin system RelB/DinJ family antitoxin n=3 Tax=Pseudomonas syringae group TaxID=136849 RepID=A0AAD2JBW6_9PSED|nr:MULTISPECIES: type II toxin-antitoxin system RelB/DinJ family antitoxin [Pseudomonas syringae group]AVB23573.1 type II toxin-antitoxin system RelB/DinJ family antitoxin [Pseudomonas avellanae]EGH14247.1 antitoxin of YafQ-DinJ toxin-antitoxin system [Pseudomonas amygdali pv. morsprunorum str. M302280]KWS70942.1 toxin-antitoxin system protein [Pseudomonas amygdali pv. morsprunorum]PHN35032.1 toxin-antitoxin system protein [Pseudomonas avellanae]POC82498.1 toxin-antitoxin system protein [Pseud
MTALLKSTDVRCRIEEDLKERATAVLSACGLSLSDAMRLFLRQVVEIRGLPFEVKAPSEKTARALAQAREIRSRFDSIDELFEDLDGKEARKTGKSKARPVAKENGVHA